LLKKRLLKTNRGGIGSVMLPILGRMMMQGCVVCRVGRGCVVCM
jgi:hypothetical protein